MRRDNLIILETPSEAGAGTRGASLGPRAVFSESLKNKSNLFEGIKWERSAHRNLEISTNSKHPNALNLDLVHAALNNSNPLIHQKLKDEKDVLIFSGDHSNGASGVSAVSNQYGKENTAVIWIDAHADLHSPYTTPSGNVHGMPLSAMLNDDNLQSQINEPSQKIKSLWSEIKALGNSKEGKLLPQNLVFIGIRDLEQPEWDIIERLNIKYFGPKEINELGIQEVCKQAEAHVAHCKNWYVSFDVDSIDPTISMGTGTPVALGLSKEEAFYCTSFFFKNKHTKAFEVTEINPLLDTENKMAAFTHDLIQNFMGA